MHTSYLLPASLVLLALAACQTVSTNTVDPLDNLVARSNEAAGATRYENGRWYSSTATEVSFQHGDRCQVAGLFVEICPDDARRVDLDGAYVIPGLGDAHNHNLDGPWTSERGRQYLSRGVFYMRSLNSVVSVNAWAAPIWETAETVDIAWSQAGISVTGGHPEMLYRGIANVYRLDPDNLEGDVFWAAPDIETLEEKWPQILETSPDWIKLFLMYTQDEGDQQLSGLSRDVFARAVELSHESGLRAVVHVNTAEDFITAINLGADGSAHLPPVFVNNRDDDEIFRITPDMAAAAAEAGFVTTPTAALVSSFDPTLPETSSVIERTVALQADNLRALRSAGAPIALGSDLWVGDAISELRALADRNVFTNSELLRIAVETPSIAIFPNRAIGTLRPGWEASFVALNCNPLDDISCVEDIRLAVKQGAVVNSAP